MAGVNVTVKPEIISWILQRIPLETATEAVFELLKKWQAGEKTPTFNQVEEVSKKTNIPFGYFFLDKPPIEECPIAEYRTVNSLSMVEPSRNLLDTLDLMMDVQNWMVEYVKDNGQEVLSFVGSVDEKYSIDRIVRAVREKLTLKVNWFAECENAVSAYKYLKNHIEMIGILVMTNSIVGNNTRRKLNVEEFRAFTLVNPYVPLIFINTCDSNTGKIFSLLHELTHVWLGVDSFYNTQMGVEFSEQKIEQVCNAVAAELLVPNQLFLAQWDDSFDILIDQVEKIAKFFRCSRYVIARKAFDHHKITKSEYDSIVSFLIKQNREWREKKKETKGGDFYRTVGSRLDRRFVLALANSAKEGKTSYTEVYRLTNTNRKTFATLLDKIGGAE
ncbi:MAG: ImmA/IrrE family metallo-endopeptidase [Lachnospiraceae bacterium]|nr:ImmA/IrrE family metallo-endopeptidase [Lachnospiraceae bacterium]